MSGAVLVGIVWLGMVGVLGTLATIRRPRVRRGERFANLRSRVTTSVDDVTSQLGPVVTAVLVVLAGWAAIIVAGWYLGALAHALEPIVDRPMFHWFQDRQVASWSAAWTRITNFGSPHITGYAAGVGAIAFAFVWRARGLRWWVPGATIWTGLLLVRYGQFILKAVVDRGHPPTTLGSYPSGGCARVIVIYGLLIVFALVSLHASRRLWVLGAWLTVFLASVQAYARTYNLEHWFTDVVGGLVFGALVIGLMIGAYFVVEPRALGRAKQVDGANSRDATVGVSRPVAAPASASPEGPPPE